jgi:hypothetical protein
MRQLLERHTGTNRGARWSPGFGQRIGPDAHDTDAPRIHLRGQDSRERLDRAAGDSAGPASQVDRRPLTRVIRVSPRDRLASRAAMEFRPPHGPGVGHACNLRSAPRARRAARKVTERQRRHPCRAPACRGSLHMRRDRDEPVSSYATPVAAEDRRGEFVMRSYVRCNGTPAIGPAVNGRA